jgi:hypothetical protein
MKNQNFMEKPDGGVMISCITSDENGQFNVFLDGRDTSYTESDRSKWQKFEESEDFKKLYDSFRIIIGWNIANSVDNKELFQAVSNSSRKGVKRKTIKKLIKNCYQIVNMLDLDHKLITVEYSYNKSYHWNPFELNKLDILKSLM